MPVMFEMCLCAVPWDGAVDEPGCIAKQDWQKCALPCLTGDWHLSLLALEMVVSLEWLPALTPWVHTRQFPPPLHQMCRWKAKGFYDFILKKSWSRRVFFARRQTPVSPGVLSVPDKCPCISQHPWHTNAEEQHWGLLSTFTSSRPGPESLLHWPFW